jgi:hypothetical protein
MVRLTKNHVPTICGEAVLCYTEPTEFTQIVARAVLLLVWFVDGFFAASRDDLCCRIKFWPRHRKARPAYDTGDGGALRQAAHLPGKPTNWSREEPTLNPLSETESQTTFGEPKNFSQLR